MCLSVFKTSLFKHLVPNFIYGLLMVIYFIYLLSFPPPSCAKSTGKEFLTLLP